MWYDQTFPGTLPLHPSGAILEDAVSKIAVSGLLDYFREPTTPWAGTTSMIISDRGQGRIPNSDTIEGRGADTKYGKASKSSEHSPMPNHAGDIFGIFFNFQTYLSDS
jgi:hypothetical protein